MVEEGGFRRRRGGGRIEGSRREGRTFESRGGGEGRGGRKRVDELVKVDMSNWGNPAEERVVSLYDCCGMC